MSEVIYIYGAGGHAKVVAATARLCGYKIGGFWESDATRVGENFFGSKVIDFSDVPLGANIFIAFGNNEIRLQEGRKLSRNYKIPNLIHPAAQVSAEAKMGIGNYIGALVNIDPDCSFGSFCLINNGANISHDTLIEDGCQLCPHCAVAGACRIYENAFIGLGSCIIEKKTVGRKSIIGAGAVVISDIADSTTVAGVPARVIK